jgi:hypothetical protein
VLLELLYQGFGTSRDARGRVHPVFGGVGVLVFGGLAGWLTAWVFPGHLFGAPVLPGASLVLSPILNGALMYYFGAWRAQHLQGNSFIATFWGGALFAFGFAVVRFVLVVDQ